MISAQGCVLIVLLGSRAFAKRQVYDSFAKAQIYSKVNVVEKGSMVISYG